MTCERSHCERVTKMARTLPSSGRVFFKRSMCVSCRANVCVSRPGQSKAFPKKPRSGVIPVGAFCCPPASPIKSWPRSKAQTVELFVLMGVLGPDRTTPVRLCCVAARLTSSPQIASGKTPENCLTAQAVFIFSPSASPLSQQACKNCHSGGHGRG